MTPMLAANTDGTKVRFPLLASAKVDGVRGVVVNGVLKSRSLLPIPNKYVTKLLSRPELSGYDGELIVGDPTAKDVFRKTSSAMSKELWEPDFTFYVFDNFEAPGTFEMRLATLKSFPKLRVQLIEQRLINNHEELMAYEKEIVGRGFEGLILRSPKGAYKFGRSTEAEGGMLKMKRFTDAEAVILGVIEEMANNNVAMRNNVGRTQRSTAKSGLSGKGRMGALEVQDVVSGVVFKIGSGFNDKDRDWFWINRKRVGGQLVKYKSFLVGVKDKPRQGVYLGGRESWDIS